MTHAVPHKSAALGALGLPSPNAGRRQLFGLGLAAGLTLFGTTAPYANTSSTPGAGGNAAAAWTPGQPILVLARADFPGGGFNRSVLGALFLRNRLTLDDGNAVSAIDSDQGALREAFYLALAGRSAAQMHAYWARMVFTGGGRPPPQLEASALVDQLRGDASGASRLGPNPIGYVGVGQDLRGARVLMVLDTR